MAYALVDSEENRLASLSDFCRVELSGSSRNVPRAWRPRAGAAGPSAGDPGDKGSFWRERPSWKGNIADGRKILYPAAVTS